MSVDELKAKGNKFFAAGKFEEAVAQFTQALAIDAENTAVLSNRSAAYIRWGANDTAKYELAVADAEQCITLAPGWEKGYSRLASAQMAQCKFKEAVQTYVKGIGADPANKLLTEGLMKAQKELANEPKDVVIGIDLGTTNCCVAVWKGDKVEIIPNDRGIKTTPSFVGFDQNTAKRTVGQAAKSLAAQNPLNTLYDVKRIIGSEFDESINRHFPYGVVKGPDNKPMIETNATMHGKKSFAPEEISGMLLGYLKKTAEQYLKQPVAKAVITVPAYFNDAQRAATVAAGRIAGLEVLRIINEPTAAALSYGLDIKDKTKGKNVLIFDLGGGTFDVSILNIKEGIFEVKATGGDTRLGGEDFDQNIMDVLIKEAEAQGLPNFSEDPRAMKRMKVAAEKAKRQLSSGQSAPIHIEAIFKKDENDRKGVDFKYTLTRAVFEKVNASLFTRTMETVKKVMRDSKIPLEDVDEIVLVGGSTRIPKLQTQLVEMFNGKELCRSVNPDEAVAYGAAIQGAVLNGQRNPDMDNLLLMDVTPLSLGIETTGSVMSVIIPRNTAIPTVKTQSYTTEENYQTEVDISVYEGERMRADENNFLGKFTITGIERAKRGEPKINVSFALDSNGILKVTAVDQKTGAAADIEIASRGRSSNEEIERMIKDAEKFRFEDEARIRRQETQNELESLMYEAAELAAKKDNATQIGVEQITSEIAEWLGANPEAQTKDLKKKKNELENQMRKFKL